MFELEKEEESKVFNFLRKEYDKHFDFRDGIEHKLIETDKLTAKYLKEELNIELDNKKYIPKELENKIKAIRNIFYMAPSILMSVDATPSTLTELFSSIYEIEEVYIFSSSPTQVLMDRLAKGTYVENGIEHHVECYIINQTYVVIYGGAFKLNFNFPFYDSITATMFKKGFHVSRDNIIPTPIKLNNSKEMYLYKNPVQLRAQTLGDSWGSTSDFYIVGEL